MELNQPLADYNGKPEIDDGHTKIANELLDAIVCHDFTKRQLVLILYIIRKTYGWNKSEDDISRSQIIEDTGLSNPNITTTMQELLSANVLIISNGKHAKRYKINKYYDQWRVINRITIIKTETVIKPITIIKSITPRYQNDNNSLSKQDPQKTITKDNTKDNISASKKSSLKTLKQYLDECKENKVQALPDDCIVFKNATTLKIDDYWLRTCWWEFKQRYFESGKKQTNWITTFNNCVKGNWFNIWAKGRDNQMYLTQQGLSLVALFEESLKND